MFPREQYPLSLQERLDETRILEDAIPDEIVWTETAQLEEPFAMSGLFEVIPGASIGPIRIELARN